MQNWKTARKQNSPGHEMPEFNWTSGRCEVGN